MSLKSLGGKSLLKKSESKFGGLVVSAELEEQFVGIDVCNIIFTLRMVQQYTPQLLLQSAEIVGNLKNLVQAADGAAECLLDSTINLTFFSEDGTANCTEIFSKQREIVMLIYERDWLFIYKGRL